MMHASTSAISEPTTPCSKPASSQERILLDAGFEAIGKGLYMQKGTVVSFGPGNGSLEVFCDLPWMNRIKLEDLRFVDVHEEYGFTRINLYSAGKDDKLLARAGNTHHSMNEEESRPLSDALKRRRHHIPDQLLLSGFEPTAGKENNYSLRESRAFSPSVNYPEARLLAEAGSYPEIGIQPQLLRLQVGRDCDTKGMELVKVAAEKDNSFRFIFESDLHRLQVLANRSGVTDRAICVRREPTLEEMNVSPAEARREANGFTVAGVNETMAIEELDALAGKDIRELEDELKKARVLGADDDLVPMLAQDNETVVGNDLSHAQLAWPLKLARGKASVHDPSMNFNGIDFTITSKPWHLGIAPTPLIPTPAPAYSITIKRADNDEQLVFWGPMADAIQDFGFYGSFKARQNTRIPPERIIEFFDLGREDED